ncbi:IS30 family transposase [Streptosporangium nondiastaticum]|uniref:IS30 family transposase n=1 Tax=Streptosporangium nondiastaticum TaxID=35764 RepID=UPI0031F8C39F
MRVRDYGLSPDRQDEVWQRWRSGESLSSIARGVGAPLQHVRRFFAQTGGVRPPAARRSLRHLQVSHETIYRSLFDPRHRAINRDLSRQLRTGRPMRHPRTARHASGRGRLRDMVSIKARPVEGETRLVAGRWEGDPVMGSRPPAIATLVERTSRYVVLVALPDGIKAAQVRPHLTRVFTGLSPQMRRSPTWDHGREMAEHRLFGNDTGVPVCFCKRRSPGSEGPARTPTGCYGSVWPGAPTCAT